MTPSLVIGDNNWAVKSDSLLGYKTIDGKYYPREMTFTRATTGTRVNEAGLVELVPYNLLTWSQDFSNSIWQKFNSTILSTNNLAPDGTLTATRINMPSASSSQLYNLFPTNVGRYTTSIWVRLVSGTGNFKLGFYDNASILTNPITVTSTWQRFSVTKTVGAFITSRGCWLYSDEINQVVEVWGGQVVEGTEPLDYLPTTDRLDIARIDYSTGEAALLLEPQRTNLALRSQELDSASVWFPVAATVSANNTTSPDGTVNADKLIATAVSSTHIILQQPAGSVSGTTSTVSIFAKAAGLSNIQIVNNAGGLGIANFNLSTGTATLVNGVSASIQDYGNGWYRCIMTYTPTSTGNFNIQIRLADNSGNTTFLGNGTDGIYLWGAQLEVGDYPTSYIPTTSASVTRNRDQCVKTGITDFIGQTEGTLFINAFGTKNVQATGKFLMQILGSKNISITFYGGNINVYSQLVDLSVPFTPNQIYKIAVCYSNSGNFRIFVNGVKTHDVNTYASGTYSDLGVGCRTIGDGPAETSINSAQLYKTALTDVECITLTTL